MYSTVSIISLCITVECTSTVCIEVLLGSQSSFWKSKQKEHGKWEFVQFRQTCVCVCFWYSLHSDSLFPCFTLSLTCSVSQWKPHACALCLPTPKERAREREGGIAKKCKKESHHQKISRGKQSEPGPAGFCHAHSEEWGVCRLRSAWEGQLRPDGCGGMYLCNRRLSLGLSERGGRLFIGHFLPLVSAPGQGILGGCGTRAPGVPEGRLLEKT